MLSQSRVEMPATAAAAGAAGIKLFGKVITTTQQPSSSSSAQAAAAAARAAAPLRLPPQGASGRGSAELLEEAARARAAAAEARLPCPRCRSRDTKFCYFNNYNVNQPRHFCRACHRYWTAGGAIRNVPVGSGRRKNRPVLPPVPPHAAAATTSPDHSSAGSGSPPAFSAPGFLPAYHGSSSHFAPSPAYTPAAAAGLAVAMDPRWWLVASAEGSIAPDRAF